MEFHDSQQDEEAEDDLDTAQRVSLSIYPALEKFITVEPFTDVTSKGKALFKAEIQALSSGQESEDER